MEVQKMPEQKGSNNCPKCGASSDHINFETFEQVGENIGFYKATCSKCEFEGKQWHKLHFMEWQDSNNDG